LPAAPSPATPAPAAWPGRATGPVCRSSPLEKRLDTVNRVVIVGAGAAGVDCAAELRRLGFTGEVTLLGEETQQPYDRPPLSKEYLTGAWTADKIALQPPGFYDENDISLRLGEQAVGLSLKSRAVMTASGGAHHFDALVIATGLRPRRLAAADDDRVLTVRTLSDAAALRDRLADARRVAVVGTGYLGSELAAGCRMLGARVTLAGPESTLLGQLGPVVGQIVTRLHHEQDVDVQAGASVVGIEAEGAVRELVLSDGSRIAADVVVVAVGSEPNNGWLADSGLAAPEGVRCDETLLAAPGVWAAGDIAAIQSLPGDGWNRYEHRLHATESALKVAARILGDSQPALPSVPYAWTDQFAHRIQIYGRVPAGATPVFTHVDPLRTSFVAVYPGTTGEVAAAVGCNAPKATRLARAWVAERRPLADVPDAAGLDPAPLL
jgi:3-phenylpropionate/trans-cinnamate dioxygenase ferredoxin reductase subunit